MRDFIVALLTIVFAFHPAAMATDSATRTPTRDIDDRERVGERQLLEGVRLRAYTGRPWVEIARLAYENPARFAEIVLPSEGPRAPGEEILADYVLAVEAEAARDESFARGEARLWREGWLRIARDAAPQLERKGAPGARRIALEFLKIESGGEAFGFEWQAEPDSSGNRAALGRWMTFLTGPQFTDSGGYRVVVADVVKMRAAPSPSAPVVARLRIATGVRVARTEGEYVEVVVRAGGSPARGFVERRFLGEGGTPEVSSLLGTARKATEAGRPDQALMWAERAFALDGSSGEALDLLEKAAWDAGKPEKAESARRLRAGQAPIYFGVCAAAGMETEHPQLVVVAKLSASGELSAVTAGEGARLASESWFVGRASVPGYRSSPFPGTVSGRPRRLSYMYGEGTLLSLGEGCKPGDVWATAPVREVNRSGINVTVLSDKFEVFRKEGFSDPVRPSAVFEAVVAPTLLDGAPVESLLVRGRARWSYVYSEPEAHPISLWGLFGPGGRLLLRVGGVPGGSTEVKEVLWAAPAFGPAWRVGFIRSESESGTTANGDVLVVVVDPTGNAKTLPVRLWDGGC